MKVIYYISDPYGEYQLGWAMIEGRKARQLVKVCKGKQGHVFCQFPSVKVSGQWQPVFIMNDKEAEKRLLDQITELVKVEMQKAAAPEQRAQQHEEQELPF